MGPLALKKLFQAPFITTLVSQNAHGAIADYQVQEPYPERLKLLVLQFANPSLASLSFSRYISQMEEEHKPQEVSGTSYQASIFKVGNSYMLCQLRGDQVLVITGSRKKISLQALANEIY